MAKIHIMRLLCPNNHCVGGMVYDPDKQTEAQAKNLIRVGLGVTGFTNRCAACGFTASEFKSEATAFATIKEAAPVIAADAERYARARAMYEQRRRAARNN